ncbi:MAG: FAD-binding protein [Clostridia bacterium]
MKRGNKKRLLSVLMVLTLLLGVAGQCTALAAPSEATGADRYTWDETFDVVVVGFGLSGAAAVVEAIDIAPDAKILLLEKMEENQAGGNSIASGQTVLHVYPDDVDKFGEYLWALGQPNPIPREWFDWWVSDMVNQIGWITDVADSVGYWWRPKEWGDAIMEFPEMPGSVFRSISTSLCRAPATATQAGGTYTGIANVAKQLKGVDIRYSTPVIDLLQDPDTKEIYGVVARDKDGKTFNVRATKGVVLACGGYENNLQMQRDFHGMDNVYTTGTPGNTGDGIQMLMKVGAQMWHMKNMTQSGGFWLGIKAPEYPSAFLRQFYFPDGGWIELDANSKRFYDEATYYHKQHMKYNQYGHWADLPHWRALPVHFICDESVRKSATLATTWMAWPISANGYRWSDDNQAEIDAGWITKADTIEELAEKINRDPADVKAAVERYNQMVDAGADTDFNRNPETMAKIDEGPFYAVELTPAIVATTGGAKRNTHSQALDWSDQPIPGLYCVGELGSYVSNLYQNGIFLNECFTSGRAAAQHIFGVAPHYDYHGNDYVAPLEEHIVAVGGSSSTLRPAMDASAEADGEYTATATATHGPYTVTCVVKDGKMTSIEVVEGRENMFMNDEQLQGFVQGILDGQSLDVDAITGATIDSEGIVSAIQLAFSRK